MKATELAAVRVSLDKPSHMEQTRVRGVIHRYAREMGVKVTVATTPDPKVMLVQRVRE